jgi:radical SAM protein with 4Fe4S-binding SPASM domain
MREIEYSRFSRVQHDRNLNNQMPSVCQFELTFQCGLRCKHCYSLCYNNPAGRKGELSTRQVKSVLDDLHGSGVLWLCLTGGDPLARKDFSQIYAYAKKKGFLITVFTSGYSMTRRIADLLKEYPPFSIEITVHASERKVYERISRVPGSWKKVRGAIDLLRERRLPLKMKMQVIKDNFKELPKVEAFAEGLGFRLTGNPFLHARLNGDRAPCALRIDPEKSQGMEDPDDPDVKDQLCRDKTFPGLRDSRFFQCAVTGGDGVFIDPNGAMVPCVCIRIPKVNVLEKGILTSRKEILKYVREMSWSGSSSCRRCSLRKFCSNCPGKALLENDDPDTPVEWFCRLARHNSGAAVRGKKVNRKEGGSNG